MTTVHTVDANCRLLGVYSTKAGAALLARFYGDGAEIGTITLDGHLAALEAGAQIYEVKMDWAGRTLSAEVMSPLTYTEVTGNIQQGSSSEVLQVYVFAHDTRQAEVLANEIRIAHLRSAQ